VITTVSSPEKANLANRAGADVIVDYVDQDVVKEVQSVAPDGVNTIVEVSPNHNAGIDAQVLGRHGTVAVYANNGGDSMELPVRAMMTPNVRWQFVLVYNAPDDWRARAIDDVSAAVADGGARIGEEVGLPVHHYSLEETADAHAAVEGGAVGKVLIDVAE
jgi:NADPH2:quinone reductase